MEIRTFIFAVRELSGRKHVGNKARVVLAIGESEDAELHPCNVLGRVAVKFAAEKDCVIESFGESASSFESASTDVTLSDPNKHYLSYKLFITAMDMITV